MVPRTLVVSAARDSRAFATGRRSANRVSAGIARVTSTEIRFVTARSDGNSCTTADDLVPHDRVLRAVVLELLAQLARRVERVVLDDDRAEPQHRVERDDVLRAVRQHDRDGIPCLDAECFQPGGRTLDRGLQIAVRGGARRRTAARARPDSRGRRPRRCRRGIRSPRRGLSAHPRHSWRSRGAGDRTSSPVQPIARCAAPRGSVTGPLTRLEGCLKSPLISCAISACSRASSSPTTRCRS